MLKAFLCKNAFRISTTTLYNAPFLFSLKFLTTTTTTSNPFILSYLIDKFGFTPECALKASKKLYFTNSQKPDSVINFFKNQGFTDSDILNIIKREPWLLSCDTHKTILPKFQFFLSKGASSSDIISLLTENPRILHISLEKRIIPLFELLSRFMKTNKDAILCLIRHSTAFSMNSYHLTVDNVNLMSDFGVPNNVIGSLLKSRPSIFGSKDLIKSLEEVKCLGFHPSLATFGVALKAKKCLSKKLWDEKVDAFKKWGWSDEAVIRTFQLQPNLMLVSIDKIDLLMSFWVNQLGWNSLALIKLPQMFCYSLEKRIIPRASVMQFLLMKGLRKKNASLAAPFSYSEKIFLSKFVFSFKKESGYLLKLYEQKMKLAYTMENNGIPFTN